MRGEKNADGNYERHKQGSPPHARGKVHGSGNKGRRLRITPACAGKSGRCRATPGAHRDHPRMRGEKENLPLALIEHLGSPPHARGKETGTGRRTTGTRITPACAGKSRRGRASGRANRDHPRMRGEKRGCPGRSSCPKGSPPHARGKGSQSCLSDRFQRITPACAGKSFSV